MKTIRGVLALAVLAVTATLAAIGNPLSAFAFLFLAGNALARQTNCLCVTLTSSEILLDVIDAFAKRIPALNSMGTDFRPNSLKLNQTYTAHIPTVPSTEDISSANYGAMTGQTARSLLTDVPITVNKHVGCSLKLQHLYSIQDNKQQYQKLIGLAGYSMAKSLIDNIITGFTSVNFSQHVQFSVANSDADMLDTITGKMNLNGCVPEGRAMIVNTPVAGTLSADSRLTSRDYAGQRVMGSGYRKWENVNGFSEITEYPDLTNTTGGTALTSVTSTAATDLFTKTAHNLATGQAVTAASFSAGTGLTSTGATYFVINVSSSTFKLASTWDNAIAGTAFDVSADGTGGVVTPVQTLTGFAFDPRAIALIAGVPDGVDTASVAQGLGINVNRVNNWEVVTHPETGITMAAISWQAAGTDDVFWVPTMVYGKALGRQAEASATGALCDYAGVRLSST